MKARHGRAINGFIGSVSFGRDLETTLTFYVNCRASFANLQPVIVYLVHVSVWGQTGLEWGKGGEGDWYQGLQG